MICYITPQAADQPTHRTDSQACFYSWIGSDERWSFKSWQSEKNTNSTCTVRRRMSQTGTVRLIWECNQTILVQSSLETVFIWTEIASINNSDVKFSLGLQRVGRWMISLRIEVHMLSIIIKSITDADDTLVLFMFLMIMFVRLYTYSSVTPNSALHCNPICISCFSHMLSNNS